MRAEAELEGSLQGRSLDRTFARGIFIVGAFSVVTSAARVAQDAAIAWRFGTGPIVDAYYFVASIANWPVAVALSVLTLLVVPLEVNLRQASQASVLKQFRGELLAGVLLLALLAWPVGWWALDAVSSGRLSGLNADTAALAAAGVPAMAAIIPLGVISALFSAWLVAAGRHVLALFEALPPLVLVTMVLLMPGPVLFWAATAGLATQVAVMAAALMLVHVLPLPRGGFASPAWKGFAGGALLLVAAQLIFALVPLVDTWFAARMEAGTLATLNFANRLVLGVQGLAGMALQRVGLVLMARLEVIDPGRARRAAVRWAVFMGGAGVLVALLVAALAEPLVALLFERGSFSAEDRAQVVSLLRWGMLQLPPFLAGLTVVTALASVGAAKFMLLAAVTGLAFKLGASAALAGALGAVGLQLATALMYIATSALAWFTLRRRLHAAG